MAAAAMLWRSLCVAAAVLAAAAPARADEEKVLNVYNWADYIGKDTVRDFEKLTGIRVDYDVYDSSQVLETKLLNGHSGYDVVVPSDRFVGKEAAAGVFRPLDRKRLPNFRNLDQTILKAAAAFDPGNAHAVPYFWDAVGIGYNAKKIRERMADAPVDSLDMIFKPEYAKRFADCGIAVLDEPDGVLQVALNYLGRSPYSAKEEDYRAAEELLMKVRPYIKYFHSSRYIDDLADGDLCLALGWNGDFRTARDRAREAANEIDYRIPREGTEITIDSLAIPADAPHPDKAALFIDYLMEPRVAADGADVVGYATANEAARGLIKPELRDDPDLYPPPKVMSRLFPDKTATPAVEQLRSRAWSRIKTGS